MVTGEERSPDARGGKGGGERMKRMSNDRGESREKDRKGIERDK